MRLRHRNRYQPTLAYVLAEQARSRGVDLDAAPGPWWASLRWHALKPMSVVTNDRTQIMVANMKRAVDVAGLLNWCDVDDLRPMPDLTPPLDSELMEGEVLRATG